VVASLPDELGHRDLPFWRDQFEIYLFGTLKQHTAASMYALLNSLVNPGRFGQVLWTSRQLILVSLRDRTEKYELTLPGMRATHPRFELIASQALRLSDERQHCIPRSCPAG